MNFPLNIPSDDAAIFSENPMPDALSHDPFSDDDDVDPEDPTGPRGQAKENEKDMFRVPSPRSRPRRIKSASGMPRASLSNRTPGAARIP